MLSATATEYYSNMHCVAVCTHESMAAAVAAAVSICVAQKLTALACPLLSMHTMDTFADSTATGRC